MMVVIGSTCPSTICTKFITNCDSLFLWKWDKNYYKVRQNKDVIKHVLILFDGNFCKAFIFDTFPLITNYENDLRLFRYC